MLSMTNGDGDVVVVMLYAMVDVDEAVIGCNEVAAACSLVDRSKAVVDKFGTRVGYVGSRIWWSDTEGGGEAEVPSIDRSTRPCEGGE